MIINKIQIKDLLLDPQNPRLPEYVGREQGQMFEYLAVASSIDELMGAIAENDFFEGESLIAIPHEEKGKYVVVEGNRRLTALKLLNGEHATGEGNRVDEIRNNAKYRPNEVPVSVYPNRSSVLNYLGNRHIAGVKTWGSLAKARYIQNLYDLSDKDNFFENCRSVARAIGSRSDYISKTLRAFAVYSFARRGGLFEEAGVSEDEIKFSLITTALDYEGISDYVYTGEVTRTPDDQLNREKLGDFISWTFKRVNKVKPYTRLKESRNLIKLSKILQNDEATVSFKNGADIDQAYLLTEGVEEDFLRLAWEALKRLREANALAPEVTISDEIDRVISSIVRQAKELGKRIDP